MQQDGVFSRIRLTDDAYTVRQKLIRNKYRVYDARGSEVLRAKQKLFRIKEDFAFTTPDGTPVFNIKAQNLLDIAGDYTLIDAETGDAVAVLHKDFTWVEHRWTIKDPDGNELAVIHSRNKVLNALRAISGLFSIVPHRYDIETPDGQQIGVIEGKFKFFYDTYVVKVAEQAQLPRELVVAAGIAIDALEHIDNSF